MSVTLTDSLNRHERRVIDAGHEPAAWRVDDWRRHVPMSRTTFYEQVKLGRIDTVKLGSATLVVTSPQDYIAALRNSLDKAA